MRYLIETTPEHAMKIGAEIARWQKQKKIELIEHGDVVEKIKTDLIRIKRAFETLDKVGIDKEVMITYIKSKANIGRNQIELVLGKQDEFFKRMGLK